jgi:5'-deoxynucleotidase YfbR-like HD superfamily hydrolase
VIVSELIEEEGGSADDALAALMHDAAEAYLGDLPHPIKHRSQLGAAFREAEKPLERVIRDRFAIAGSAAAVKRIDRALLATERRMFSAETWHWPELAGVEPLDLEIEAWLPDDAAEAFTRRFDELDARRRARGSQV